MCCLVLNEFLTRSQAKGKRLLRRGLQNCVHCTAPNTICQNYADIRMIPDILLSADYHLPAENLYKSEELIEDTSTIHYLSRDKRINSITYTK